MCFEVDYGLDYKYWWAANLGSSHSQVSQVRCHLIKNGNRGCPRSIIYSDLNVEKWVGARRVRKS